MTTQQKIVLAAVLLAGYLLGGGEIIPQPQPQPSRPVLRWFVGVARNLLWTAAFLEPAPPDPKHSDHAVVRSAPIEIGEDGAPVVNHVRGF